MRLSHCFKSNSSTSKRKTIVKKAGTDKLAESTLRGVDLRAWKGMGIEFRGEMHGQPAPAEKSLSESPASPMSRRKRSSLLAMAALTLVGLSPRNPDAGPLVPKDAKDASETGKAPAQKIDQATPAQPVHNFKIPAGPL